jgi:NAD(P)-dependent dehydrogenase (short-subunit alcohol dehydrogenase family)
VSDSGQVHVLVTGGATGIGLGITQHLLSKGMRVSVCSRRPEPLKAAAALGAEAVQWDLTQTNGLIQKLTPLTHLVHCAGNDNNDHIGRWHKSAFQDTLALHAVAAAMLMQDWAAQAPAGGCFVGVSSTLGRRSAPGKAAYAAAKAAMLSICQSGAIELAPGLRVNAVLPGVVETDMTRVPRSPGADVQAQLAGLAALHPLGRLGTASEVAVAVAYLLEAQWTTGAELVVDGGLSL